jgi:hypothetical protein
VIPEGCRLEVLTAKGHDGLYRYLPPRGLAALLAPGEELLLAPRWPLMAGLARLPGAVPVDVLALWPESAVELVASAERLAGERSHGLNSPSPAPVPGARLRRSPTVRGFAG